MISPELKAHLSNLQDLVALVGLAIVFNILMYKMWLYIYIVIYNLKEARIRAFRMGWMSTIAILPLIYLLLFNKKGF